LKDKYYNFEQNGYCESKYSSDFQVSKARKEFDEFFYTYPSSATQSPYDDYIREILYLEAELAHLQVRYDKVAEWEKELLAREALLNATPDQRLEEIRAQERVAAEKLAHAESVKQTVLDMLQAAEHSKEQFEKQKQDWEQQTQTLIEQYKTRVRQEVQQEVQKEAQHVQQEAVVLAKNRQEQEIEAERLRGLRHALADREATVAFKEALVAEAMAKLNVAKRLDGPIERRLEI
jgi:hypothetical protein